LRGGPAAVTIAGVPRPRPLLLAVLCLLLALPAFASAHAVLRESTPPLGEAVATPPERVVLRFTEPVQLLDPGDLQVVDGTGEPVTAGGAREVAGDSAAIEVGLRPDLPQATYTVRYKVVSADSHIIAGARPFAVGPGPVGAPYLGQGIDEGPSETSAWAVSARFFELVCLGGLLGLIAFRWLVWGPVWRPGRWAAQAPAADREAALNWGRDVFWVAFGALAVAAMVAEGFLLVTYSANALGTTVWDTVRDTAGIGDVLGTTRFGSLLQVRGAVLFALFAIGAWQFLAEFGSTAEPRPATPSGARLPAALMAVLVLVVLYGISSQGHASQAPWAPLQIGADLVHLAATAVWVAGLGMLVAVLLRLPRVTPAGKAIATAVLVRFSTVALLAVVAVAVTGTIRAVGQLDDPAQLWETAYGRSILYKVALLAPAGLLALYNRRVVNTLVRVRRPSAGALRIVRRNASAELALTIAIVLVASLLVAQVPGRV
jgi:copper transport protein